MRILFFPLESSISHMVSSLKGDFAQFYHYTSTNSMFLGDNTYDCNLVLNKVIFYEEMGYEKKKLYHKKAKSDGFFKTLRLSDMLLISSGITMAAFQPPSSV